MGGRGKVGIGREKTNGRMTLRGRIHVRKIVGKGRKGGWKERIAKRDHREGVGMGEGREQGKGQEERRVTCYREKYYFTCT